ncbi:MAG: hypothetical protein M1457_06035, partial [bacterium]|nr:hypothetical protein [bacterium]
MVPAAHHNPPHRNDDGCPRDGGLPGRTGDDLPAGEPAVSAPAARLDRLIARPCREAMAGDIAAVGGAEVYFIGRLNARLTVAKAESYAFGNRRAVPALMQYARPGDVVIHNHPSGALDPSDADIAVSSPITQSLTHVARLRLYPLTKYGNSHGRGPQPSKAIP